MTISDYNTGNTIREISEEEARRYLDLSENGECSGGTGAIDGSEFGHEGTIYSDDCDELIERAVKSTKFGFTKTDKRTELQKDAFFAYCITDLDTDLKFWTDDLSEAKAAAAGLGVALIWDTAENQEVS